MTVYYNPEQYDLRLIDSIFDDAAAEDWGFRVLAVWEHPDGLFMAEDSGCSCPAPFEDYHSVEALERLNYDELKSRVKHFRTSSDARSRFLRRVRDRVNARK